MERYWIISFHLFNIFSKFDTLSFCSSIGHFSKNPVHLEFVAMRKRSNQITTGLILFWLFCTSIVFGQKQYFILQEIVQNRTDNRSTLPSRIEVDSKGGFVEFSVMYGGNCIEYYRVDFTFDQDMRVLEQEKDYYFSLRTQRVKGKCEIYPIRDPFAKAGAANGASSALFGGTSYKPLVNGMGMSSGWDRLYVNGAFNGAKTGSLRGSFRGSRNNKLGAYSFFNISINGASNIGYDKSFQYEILFIYKIVDSPPSSPEISEMSCPPPDCSGFPGTVPVWNFQTQRGECWCPEGMVWDKMTAKCVRAN